MHLVLLVVLLLDARRQQLLLPLGNVQMRLLRKPTSLVIQSRAKQPSPPGLPANRGKGAPQGGSGPFNALLLELVHIPLLFNRIILLRIVTLL